ncbi:MAG: hypothetical protein B6245_18980 [Desulfobacteraceae bacterium 4572_88]|nr:MAG: hypothetical protein B6245_18980 [Desulfobacteraceae bacterium 4572_88]
MPQQRTLNQKQLRLADEREKGYSFQHEIQILKNGKAVDSQKAKKPDRTDWHSLWGLMMAPLFERLGCETVVDMDLSAKIQRLDMVVVTKQAEELAYDELPPDYYEGFESLNEHNLISLKSFREVFNVTAPEELYGHCINYRKIRDIGERDKGRVNLYAVTHHFPGSVRQLDIS